MDDYFPDSIGLQTVAYTAVASMAALLFDFIITFDSEVRWTWGTKWGITRIAFVVSRYLPFVGLAMAMYYTIESTRGGIPNNGRFTAGFDDIRWLGIVAAEVPLLVRTYVVWGCSKKFLIALLVFSTAIAAVALAVANFDAFHSGATTRGVFESGKDASILYGLLMFYELTLMSLTLYKRSKFYRLEGSPIVTIMYRDGIIYVLCIALVSMANCVSIAALPTSYTSLLAGPQLVMHSVLASRILFNLRAMTELQDVVAVQSGMGMGMRMGSGTLGTIVFQPIAFQIPPPPLDINREELL